MSGQWNIPVVALNAVTVNTGTSPVTGSVIDLGEVREEHGVQINVTGFSGSGTVAASLMGSLDGSNWYNIGNIPGGTSVNEINMETATFVPARYVQATAEVFSGTPTATVTVISVSRAA